MRTFSDIETLYGISIERYDVIQNVCEFEMQYSYPVTVCYMIQDPLIKAFHEILIEALEHLYLQQTIKRKEFLENMIRKILLTQNLCKSYCLASRFSIDAFTQKLPENLGRELRQFFNLVEDGNKFEEIFNRQFANLGLNLYKDENNTIQGIQYNPLR